MGHRRDGAAADHSRRRDDVEPDIHRSRRCPISADAEFQRAEVAGLFRVPLHLLQDLERATNNNIEHQSLDYIRYTLRPWAVRIEQEINRKLLGASFFCEHDINEFQRGDFATQTTGLRTLRDMGAYSANDVLRALRKNPIPAEEGGDVRLAPMNMIPLTSLVGQAAPADKDTGNQGVTGDPVAGLGRDRIISAYRRLFRDAGGRIANRKDRDPRFAHRALQPILASMAEAILATELSEQQDASVSHCVEVLASEAADWTPQNVSTAALRLTEEAYDALQKALMGGLGK
jgi:Phage portal protein